MGKYFINEWDSKNNYSNFIILNLNLNMNSIIRLFKNYDFLNIDKDFDETQLEYYEMYYDEERISNPELFHDEKYLELISLDGKDTNCNCVGFSLENFYNKLSTHFLRLYLFNNYNSEEDYYYNSDLLNTLLLLFKHNCCNMEGKCFSDKEILEFLKEKYINNHDKCVVEEIVEENKKII